MLRSFLSCALLLFVLNDSACETAPSDAKNQSHKIQPGENPDANNKIGRPVATPEYAAQATLELKENDVEKYGSQRKKTTCGVYGS
jgi:hypothetical protein